jgi:hypothetical protein
MAAPTGIHEDFSRGLEHKTSSDRSFGLIFAGFFLIVGVSSAWRGGSWWPFAFPLSLAFAGVALVRPALLTPMNRLWTKFGLLLSKIMNPLVLGILFYATVVPIGLLMRATGKDPLRLKFDRAAPSYWIVREPPGPPAESMKNQF